LIPPETGEYKIGISAAECGYRLYLNGELMIDQWDLGVKENFEAMFTTGNRNVSLHLAKDVPLDLRVEFSKKGNRNFIRLEWEIPGSNSIEMAKRVAKKSDAVLIFAGLSNFFEGGNNDRPDIMLPGEQNKLISEVAKVNPNTVVVLINGSAVAMPWINDVAAVVEAYYPGQEGGNAIANVLFGRINPSGKLPETFPVLLSDNPAYDTYPGKDNKTYYSEGIYVGYRHYDRRNIEPLFPFGHGLSYTTFEYNDLTINNKDEVITVDFTITNTGKTDGAEVAQLYLRDIVSSEDRPLKELKNFEKIYLKAGETKSVSFEITNIDLSFFSAKQNKWVSEPGEFEALIGSSSRDIRLKSRFFK
jgi:beta-glucosidase